MDTRAVVIGAGVVGSAIALELARAGMEVVVIDKAGAPGHGSTAASSAIVRFNYSTWEGVAASWEAKHGWLAWRDYLGSSARAEPARFVKTGLAMLDAAATPRHKYLPLFERAGVPYREWDATQLATAIDGIDTGRYGPPARLDDERFWAEPNGRLGAVFTPDAGYINDPQLAADDLAAAALAAGARFRFHRTVTGIPHAAGRVAGVRLDDGTLLEADIVVNAAGPWSAHLNRLAEADTDFTLTVRPLRQEVHHIPAPAGYAPSEAEPGITIADLDLGVYLRGVPGGSMMVGGTEPECDRLQWLESADELDPRPTMAVFDAQVTRAARRFPRLGVPGRAKGVAGVYDVTDDWTPIYDRTALPGFYVAIGTSGNQFKNAPIIGTLMVRLITEVENGADHDTNPVRFIGAHTGAHIDLAAFSRKRVANHSSTGTVFG